MSVRRILHTLSGESLCLCGSVGHYVLSRITTISYLIFSLLEIAWVEVVCEVPEALLGVPGTVGRSEVYGLNGRSRGAQKRREGSKNKTGRGQETERHVSLKGFKLEQVPADVELHDFMSCLIAGLVEVHHGPNMQTLPMTS